MDEPQKKSSTLENLTLFLAILKKQILGSFNKYVLTFFLLWLDSNLSFIRLNRPSGEDEVAAHHMYPYIVMLGCTAAVSCCTGSIGETSPWSH